MLELPDYRMPSLRTALLTVYDRGGIFLRKAGTVILLISVVLWALTNYPKVDSGTVASVASAGDLALLAQLEPAAAAGAGHGDVRQPAAPSAR